MDAAQPREDLLQAVRAAAQGDVRGLAFLERWPAEFRAAFLELVQTCGQQILRLETLEARKEENLQDLRIMIEGVSRTKQRLRAENSALRAAEYRRPVIGADGGLREVMKLADKALLAPIPVLVTGETGTGKEVLARYLHGHGPRADGPFVAINCAAIPESLLEAELFGIERGVATGVGKRTGKLEQADGGTIFLDELGDMSPAMQAKILRVLQEREVVPIGATHPIPFDARIISATNRDLEERMRAGEFREDLYYRLVGLRLDLPPLRERLEDLEPLTKSFAEDAARRFSLPLRSFDAAAMAALRRYSWPGNVRELMAEVQRAVVVAGTDVIGPAGLSPRIAGTEAKAQAQAPGQAPAPRDERAALVPLREARLRFEAQYISAAMARERKLKDVAKLLGITPEGLRRKILFFDLKR